MLVNCYEESDSEGIVSIFLIESGKENLDEISQISVRLKYQIEAATFEEALAIHYLRMGYGPYQPGSEPLECPLCSNYYYLGSGKCFCGYDKDLE